VTKLIRDQGSKKNSLQQQKNSFFCSNKISVNKVAIAYFRSSNLL
jgi:hypothetical protein